MNGIVLVPLDGSPSAQAAIPFAAWFADRTRRNIALLRVADEHQQSESQLATARDELDSIATSIRTENKAVSAEVRTGKPADVVDAYAANNDISFVVLTTIGHGGDARHLGSVADRLSHTLTRPAIYIPPACDVRAPVEGPLIVGLDGSEAAESILPIPQELALQLDLELRLVRVAPWANELFATFTGLAPPSADEEIELGTNTYLANFADRLPEGISWDYQTLRGHPAEMLIEYGENQRGMLVLGSHGETGNALWHLGGTTEKVLRAGAVPVLVVPVPHKEKD